jgi:hypothetical protein
MLPQPFMCPHCREAKLWWGRLQFASGRWDEQARGGGGIVLTEAGINVVKYIDYPENRFVSFVWIIVKVNAILVLLLVTCDMSEEGMRVCILKIGRIAGCGYLMFVNHD